MHFYDHKNTFKNSKKTRYKQRGKKLDEKFRPRCMRVFVRRKIIQQLANVFSPKRLPRATSDWRRLLSAART